MNKYIFCIGVFAYLCFLSLPVCAIDYTFNFDASGNRTLGLNTWYYPYDDSGTHYELLHANGGSCGQTQGVGISCSGIAKLFINIDETIPLDEYVTDVNLYLSSESGTTYRNMPGAFAYLSVGWNNFAFGTPSLFSDIKDQVLVSSGHYAFLYLELDSGASWTMTKLIIKTNATIDYGNTNSILFSNTTDYSNNITAHTVDDLLYVTTFLNNSNWNFWTNAFANLRIIDPDGVQIEDLSIYQQNASQFSFTPVNDGVYTTEIYCGILCYPFTEKTETVFVSSSIDVSYPYNSPDDLLFSHTLDYSTSITEHPLNESFYLNVWIENGSSMRESDFFGHWRINVTSPTDTYLGTYYPVRNHYQGSYPIQISMDQFNGTGKFGNYTFKMFFALTPDEVNNGEVLIKESVIYLFNSSNYSDTGYYDNITEEMGNVQDVDISNYTDIPDLQYLNNSFSYETFVWIATPIHSMHTGIDSINDYYSDTNNTQHITVLGSIVPILISELPEKVKLLFTYQIILTVILLIMGRD